MIQKENSNEELLKLLFIAQDYLQQHWDMESEPLNQIRLRLLQSDALNLLRKGKYGKMLNIG